MNKLKLRNMLEDFLIEDIGAGDLTSNAIFSSDARGDGIFIAKEAGVISGTFIIEAVYHLLDPSIIVETFFNDGDFIKAGEKIASVTGPIIQLLSGERVILNLMQRMSGIATMTRKCVETLDDDSIRICDTRKTIPGLRMLEKYAVVTGGGKNHRNGLYDGVMIKDNHISFCGSIANAVEAVRSEIGHMVKIEVETESVQQVVEAVHENVDIIMFDNQDPESIQKLAAYVPPHIITEASGGITLENLADYRGLDIDYISLGALTHSVKALDISFLQLQTDSNDLEPSFLKYFHSIEEDNQQ